MNLNPLKYLFRHTQEPIPDKPPVGTEQAHSEDGFFGGGVKFEKWRMDDLIQRKGFDLYEKMQADDQVESALSLVSAAITGRRWSFVVDDPELQEEAADILTHNMTKAMKGTMDQLLIFMLTARTEGFSLVEKVFGTFEKDGRMWWGLETYKLRPAHSFTFEVDVHGNIKNLIQDQASISRENLDIHRFIHTVNRPEFDAHYGRSALVPVYPHFWAKTNLYRFWEIFSERAGGGFLLGTVEKTLTPPQETALRDVMRNMQASTSVTVPAGVKMEYVIPDDHGTFKAHIADRNGAINRALLVPTLIGFGEETSTGSNARAQAQLQAWFLVLDKIADVLAATLNEQLFRELAWWNFGLTDPPLFKFEQLTAEQKEKFAEQWISAVKEGAVLNTFEDELRLRDMVSFPAREEDAEPVDIGGSSVPGEEGPDIEPLEPINVDAEGENPIGDALADGRVLISQAANAENSDDDRQIKRDASLDQLKFGDRVDAVETNETFQVLTENAGRVLFEGVDDIFNQMTTQIFAFSQGEFDDVTQIQANPEQTAALEQGFFVELTKAFDEGRAAGLQSFNVAASQHGKRRKRPKKRGTLLETKLSAVGRQYMKLKYALDAESAEEFLRVQAFEMVGHVVNDTMLTAIRQAVLNGLVNEQSVEMMIENAIKALEPIIGERDSAGNIITAAALPARIATITNTALSQAYNEGLRSFFEDPDQDGFVEAYQYSAILDARTTLFCKNAHGRIWPVDSPFWQRYLPPNHFNCRSIIIPVVQGDEFTVSRDLPLDGRTGKQIQPDPGFG